VRWANVVILSIVILLPVFIKNYIVTGYPFFPATLTINSPDWQLPKPLADKFLRYIVLSNRFYNWNWSFIKNIQPVGFNWIPYWYSGILWQHKMILALAIGSMSFLVRKSNNNINGKSLKHLTIILLAMIAGWFLTAPDPGRFGYGILLTTAFLTTSLFLYPFVNSNLYKPVLSIITVLIVAYIYMKSTLIIEDLQYLRHPIVFTIPPTKTIRNGDIQLNLPYKINGNWDCRCFFTPLPCVTQENPYLEPRGLSLKEGFKMKAQIKDTNFILNYNF
jgi:hypothetical protein